MKVFFRTILYSVLWAMIFLLAFLLVNNALIRYVKNDPRGGLFGIGYAVVISGSMEPALSVDDMIFYQSVSEEKYEVGDIVVFEREKAGKTDLVTHRIVELTEKTVTTKGDANNVKDDSFPKEKLVGRVVFSVPKVGTVMHFMTTETGMIIGIAVIVILIILCILVSFIGKKEKRKKGTA